jgi:hypothetical protein
MARREPSAVGDLLRPLVRDRVFVLVGAPVRPLRVEAVSLLDLGARRVLIIGDGVGSVEPAPRDGLSWLTLEVSGGTVSEARHRAARQLSALPATILAALDRIDPAGSAWVVNANNICTDPTIGGREVLGRARAEWTALEDKTCCDELWDAAGVAHAPFEIVAATRDDLLGAARRLDQGAGTVWAGDARDWVHGGAELTRWIRDDDDLEPVAESLSAHCDRARVMPFLEGIPCSIHGVVTVDGIAALRPCEMIVLRDDTPGHLRFVGVATGWDPDQRDRDEMRDVARRVGRLLRDRYGYLGTFTVDGIVTDHGFLPTELNPRVGGALALMSASIPETGLVMHTQFLAHQIDTGIRATDIEDLVLPAADANANRGLWASELISQQVDRSEHPIILEEGHPRLTRDDEQRDGEIRIAPVHSYTPSAVVIDIDPGHLPVGPSSAPLVADALHLASTISAIPLGHYEPARAVR